MEKRYSEMSEGELRAEIATLKEKARKAEQMGIINEFAVYERKIAVAKSYMLDPSSFIEGAVYGIEGAENETFQIEYMNGIFAWGYRNGGQEEEALPISLLIKKD